MLVTVSSAVISLLCLFRADGSVKLFLNYQPHIEAVIFESGYPMSEINSFDVIKKKKAKSPKKKKGRFSTDGLFANPATPGADDIITGYRERSMLQWDGRIADVEAEEKRIAEEEAEDQRRARERALRKKLLAQQKALSYVKDKFDYLKKFVDEDKKSPEERNDVSIMINRFIIILL